MITGAFQVVTTLVAIAALLVLFAGAAYAVAWLVGLGLRYAPLVGRRHRNHSLVAREPIETESSKHWSGRRP
jgi:hypothetical protein